MSRYRRSLDPEKPTVHVHVRETPSGGFKLRLMSIDKPAPERGVFRSSKEDS